MTEDFQAQGVKRNLPRDVFLHLFAIVTMYWSAISFITLCWQYINYFFPDVLNYNYGYTGFAGPIRFAVSSLIIVFPLFILISWILNKIYAKEAQVRESKIRKWLIYFTLFIASLVIVGDLTSIINTFLGGEVKVRFILKTISVLVVAGVVFGYYLDDVRRNVPSKLAKLFALITSVIILISVIGAFFIVGSPMQARLVQFDQQKVSDLQNIQFQIVDYSQRKGQLPQNLSDLNDSISGYIVPNDPQTSQPYEYNIKNVTNLNFELCANFNSSSNLNNVESAPAPVATYPAGYTDDNWDHYAGRVCFERTIDQQC
ncbi:MAG: hypothetical protein HY219_01480 [Candidatus Staskawiczbacteria bacterium]|nr:hypothetical protein [Candidatus Staskawiczbacteria bacterium]